MRTVNRLLVFVCLTLGTHAQIVLPTLGPRIVERGAHYNIFEQTWSVTNQITGAILSRVSHYTELGNGLNYLKDGNYQESNEQFEIGLDGSAVARHTLSQVILAPNLNTAGSFDLLGPDNKRLRGHV